MRNRKKILLAGGGTAGSVTPLLAVADELRKQNYEFLWIGTRGGIERGMVEGENIKFKTIYCGKLRRYFSWMNFIDPFKIILGFVQAFFILRKFKPDAVMSAGGFVAVPVSCAAFILRIPVLVHQMDVRAGLANKIIAPIAKVITTTFKSSVKDYGAKAVCIGNPVRNKLSNFSISRREAFQKLGLTSHLPIVLVMGGGTGAERLNTFVTNNFNNLKKFSQIIHLTGVGKSTNIKDNEKYHAFEFLDVNGMMKVLTVADVVVSRCGMGVLTELSHFAKPSILIPMPDSHQEDNAQVFFDNSAAVVLSEKIIDNDSFVSSVKKVVLDDSLKQELSRNVKDIISNNAITKISKILKNL
jgi:UDP-N-acetylglucosamine--N-acetylmuramyl-(pentapeptide) pyrophosphoryl-undecaprenol N-acetylglucosamine transferase